MRIDGKVLRDRRIAKGFSQSELAKRARVNKQTISRLERGTQQARRDYVVQGLCDALDIERAVLAGQKMNAGDDGPRSSELSDKRTEQLNIRIGRDIRNALSLVALRYRVPATRIVELAALGFLLQAETSLRRRREKLISLESELDRLRDHQRKFPHLPPLVVPPYELEAVICEERRSIEMRDLEADEISEDVWMRYTPSPEYSYETHNPFAAHLKDTLAKLEEPAEFVGWTKSRCIGYRICREDVVRLLGDDEEVVDAILEGWVLLHKMPSELLSNGSVSDRAAWTRHTLADWRAQKDDLGPVRV